MIHIIYFILLLILSLIFQGYLDLITISGIKPDLLLILIIYFSFKEGEFRGLFLGFGSGLLQDAVSAAYVPLGFQAMPKAIIGFLLGKYSNLIRGESLLSLSLLIFLISIFHGIFILILAFIFIQAHFEMIYTVVFPQAIYTAVLGPILFTIYDKLFSTGISFGK